MVIPQRYQQAINSLKAQLLFELGDQLHSIVLFGSVARGEAGTDSDIDILILTEGPHENKKRIYDGSYDIGRKHQVVMQPVLFTTQRFKEEAGMRSWLFSDIISQGIVLHDDGTYRRIREEASSALRGIP